MNSRCKSCMFRAADGAGSCGGCAYLQITGKSRLKSVYKRLGVNWMTDAVRVAMRPENCLCYCEGERAEIEDGRRITLEGSTPEPGQAAARSSKDKAGQPKTPKPPKEPRPPKWDKEKAQTLYEQGMNDREIGAALGVRSSTVYLWRSQRLLPPNWNPPDRSQQLRAMWAEGKDDHEIAEEMGLRPKTVQTWRCKAGLPRNPTKKERERAEGLQKRRALYDQGLTDQEIAQRLGLKTQTVTKWRWDMGLRVNEAERRRPIVDGARLKQLYREGLTDRQIAAQMGLKVDTVRSWRQRRHMPVNQDHKGHRITWETKALQLHAEGLTDLEIAKAVGRSRSSVSMWRRKKGLPINQAIQGPKKENAHGDL